LDKPRHARYQNRVITVGDTHATKIATTIIFHCPLGGVFSFANFRFISGADPHGLKMTQFDILSQSAPPQALLELLNIDFGPGRVTRTAERLREGNQRLGEYDRMAVAKKDGALVGAIAFWPIAIAENAGLLLGPLAVHPDVQGQGVGLALMQNALAAIDDKRFTFTLLVGDLPYYQKGGFTIAPSAVKLPGPVDPQRLLVRGEAKLCGGLSGMVRRAPELC
jgi:predicted N-acetyltransferase YhbS